jgi:glyoxylase-like metal-dependent hydrolase (beta-lactamase superfamily II)
MAAEPLFRQIFDPDSSVLTYLIGDASSGTALVIDPLPVQNMLILALLAEMGLSLRSVVRTHVHRPNRIDSGGLCELTGADYLVGQGNPGDIPGRRLADGEEIALGGERLLVLATPGHTPGCISLRWRDKLFCGDVMEIGGCGQAEDETNPAQMYDSVTMRIFTLPAETLLYPCHDYVGRRVSSVGEEKLRNSWFALGSRDLFVARMHAAKTAE